MAKKKAKEKAKEKDDKEDPRAPVARDGAYVMMLFITLVAIAAGCVFMYLDHDEYSSKAAPKEPVPAIIDLGKKPAAEPKGDPGAPAPAPAPAP